MSGSGQAKVKKKSAKKAAVVAASEAKGARLNEFIIGNVRCFAEEQRAPIRPITLLVGENSTGKTTFLGGYRVLHNLTSSSYSSGEEIKRSMTFNDDPFQMGAFRDIVNRGVVSSASPSFQLGAHVHFQSMMNVSSRGNSMKVRRGTIKVVYSFREDGSSAVAHKVSLLFSNGEQIDVVRGKHRFDEYHDIVFTDPKTGNCLEVGDLAQTITLQEIAMSMFRMRRKETIKGGTKKVSKILDDQFAPAGKRNGAWLHVSFDKRSIEYSMAPIRSKPKRTYDPVSDEYNPEGGHIPMFLAQLSRTHKDEWKWLRKRLIDFGKESGLFSDFKVKELGPHVSDPFQIHVKVSGIASNMVDVGYGVGQVYPLLTQIMRASQQGARATFLVQQPEVHLHPRAQAALGSFFVRSVKDDRHAFIIEAHSDFIVDRVCMHVAEGDIDPDDVSLLYFEKQKSGGAVKIHRIELNDNGEPVSVPQGYRDFFLRETERALGFKD